MAIHLSYTFLFICEEDDIKILRNQDLGYNCGKQNYFVILWKTTKKTLYYRILLMDIDLDLVYL